MDEDVYMAEEIERLMNEDEMTETGIEMKK